MCEFAFLSWLLWDGSSFVRVPGSLVPPHPLCALLFCPGFSETALVLLGFQLLWIPPHSFCVLASQRQLWFVLLGFQLLWIRPHAFCAFAFQSWLPWDSRLFFSVPATLGLSPPVVCFFLLWLLRDSASFVRVPGSLGPSPHLVCFAFLSWLLRDSSSYVRVPASLDPSPSILCFCFSVLASLGQSFVLLETLGLSPTLVCFCFSVVASLGRL